MIVIDRRVPVAEGNEKVTSAIIVNDHLVKVIDKGS